MSKEQTGQAAGSSMRPFRVSNVSISLGNAVIAALIYLLFIAILLPLTNNNLYGLYGFSRELTHPGLEINPWDEYTHPKPGYDGQFYYSLALDPLTSKWEAFGIRFDAPLLRQQRTLCTIFHLADCEEGIRQ